MTPAPDRAPGSGTAGRDLGALPDDQIDRRGAPTQGIPDGLCERWPSGCVALCFEERDHGAEICHGALGCERPLRGLC